MRPDYSVHDKKYIEARAKGWNGWGGDERIAHEHIWLERLFSFSQVPKSGQALELGCGEGHYARLLAEKGYTVLGVDVSPTAITWAEEKTQDSGLAVSYQEVDLTETGVLKGQRFDLIADGNCVHCIIGADRAVFLDNAHRLLKDNGLFYISSLCSHSGKDEVVELDGKPYRHVPTLDNFHAELEATGFNIQQSVFHKKDIGPRSHCTIHVTKR
ncbi:MAG: class I SAM-dependent methyltransferase [Chloroflexota bacterium]